MMRCLFSFLMVAFLSGCGGGDPGFVRLGDYECDAGEAVVRHMIKSLPDVAPGLPKEYCVVKALDLRAADMDFVRRFGDMGLTFVSGEVISEQEETHYPVNPKSGLSPVMLHLQKMHKSDPQTYEIDAGWAYKRTFDRRKFRVQKTGDKWVVQELARLDGNATP